MTRIEYTYIIDGKLIQDYIICIFINSIKNLLFLNISNRYIVTYKIKNILK